MTKAESSVVVHNSTVVMVSAGDLTTHPRNARRGDIEIIRKSIRKNGFFGTLLVQSSTGFIVAGNHRYIAGVQEGMTEFPVIMLDVDDETALRILLVDNKASDLSTWNSDDLLAILQDIPDLDGTGFRPSELEALLSSFEPVPDFDSKEEQPSGVKISIGHYKFSVEEPDYNEWLRDIIAAAGGEEDEIAAEIRGRLGL